MLHSDFVAELKTLIKEQLRGVHTAMPGEIVSVDTATGLAKVLPKGRVSAGKGKYADYPPVSGVPLVFPSGAGSEAGVTFPVRAGDQCLIVFCEQSTDSYLGKGSASYELPHGLSGAVAIPGLMRAPTEDFSEAQESGGVIVRCGDTRVRVTGDGVEIEGDLTVSGGVSSSALPGIGEDDDGKVLCAEDGAYALKSLSDLAGFVLTETE